MTESERIDALEKQVASLKRQYAETMDLLTQAVRQINTVAGAVRDVQKRQKGHALILP